MMPLAIGYLELATILVTAVVTSTMFLGRFSYRHWSAVNLGCVTLAAILTPADLLSMLLMTIAFIGVYLVGTRHQTGANIRHTQNATGAN